MKIIVSIQQKKDSTASFEITRICPITISVKPESVDITKIFFYSANIKL